jgi:starvation-inducible outer membrane lipoprotein
MNYDWKFLEMADNGYTLWRDGTSHIYAICNPWTLPDDRDASVFGVTPENTDFAEALWREARLET